MTRFSFLVLLLLTRFSAAHSQTDSTLYRIASYLEELSADPHFSLAISIASPDRVLLEKAYGYANRSHQIKNRIDTRFNIASIGKLFTAVSILQLEEQGKLSLSAPVGTYLPEFPHSFIRDSLTIHQLLTHSSGLPLWFNEAFDQNPKFAYEELADYLPLYEALSINRDKRGEYGYSNVGFIMLGFVIEAITEMSYKEYVNAFIFRPVGMKETNLWKLTEIIPDVATGYIRPAHADDWWKSNYHLNKGSSPAGGAYASARDLILFYQALMRHDLLQASTQARMFSPQIQTGYGQYGYGIGINTINDSKVIGHLGGYYGARGELMWYTASNYIVSILANSDQTDYADISYFIQTELTGSQKQKESYKRTAAFLASDIFSKEQLDPDEIASFSRQHYDEGLIQIKGYYHFNNKAYDKAKRYFYVNFLLFPDSEAAKRDWEKVKDK